MFFLLFFFFSSRRRHTRCLSDWSSDVCSSDLLRAAPASRARPPGSLGTGRAPLRADRRGASLLCARSEGPRRSPPQRRRLRPEAPLLFLGGGPRGSAPRARDGRRRAPSFRPRRHRVRRAHPAPGRASAFSARFARGSALPPHEPRLRPSRAPRAARHRAHVFRTGSAVRLRASRTGGRVADGKPALPPRRDGPRRPHEGPRRLPALSGDGGEPRVGAAAWSAARLLPRLVSPSLGGTSPRLARRCGNLGSPGLPGRRRGAKPVGPRGRGHGPSAPHLLLRVPVSDRLPAVVLGLAPPAHGR